MKCIKKLENSVIDKIAAGEVRKIYFFYKIACIN